MTEKQTTEFVELTHTMFEALLNMTGGDPDLHLPAKRRLTAALHKARFVYGSRWAIEVDEEILKAIHVHLTGFTLNRPSLRARFHRYLCHQSDAYRRVDEMVEADREAGVGV